MRSLTSASRCVGAGRFISGCPSVLGSLELTWQNSAVILHESLGSIEKPAWPPIPLIYGPSAWEGGERAQWKGKAQGPMCVMLQPCPALHWVGWGSSRLGLTSFPPAPVASNRPGPWKFPLGLFFHCCCSIAKSCPTPCDSIDCSNARLPCPSLSAGVCSNWCPLSQWCHPATSSSVISFSSCPQFFPAERSFPMTRLFAPDGQSTWASASASVLEFFPIH